MADDRRPYATDEEDPFSWIDDELEDEEKVEEEILESEDYKGADQFGTTPDEERRGVPVEEQLTEEVPDERAESVSDDWEDAPDPKAGTLVDSWDVFAEDSRAPAEDPAQDALHETADDRTREAEIREADEEGPPANPRLDKAPLEAEEPQPAPEDWR